MIFMFFSISHPRGTWWWWVVLLAGAAHRVSGKEGPHHGGLHFDEHLLCFFHRGPHFPGNSFVYSVSSLDMHDYRSHSSSFRQAASPVIPYISMACVFAFILSFGLGPGKEPEYSFFLSPSNQLLLLVPHALPPYMQVEWQTSWPLSSSLRQRGRLRMLSQGRWIGSASSSLAWSSLSLW